MREKFEAWAKDYVKGRLADGRYSSPYTQIAWEAWHAALRSDDALRWPIQAEGIGIILAEHAVPKPENIPYVAVKIADAIQTGNY